MKNPFHDWYLADWIEAAIWYSFVTVGLYGLVSAWMKGG